MMSCAPSLGTRLASARAACWRQRALHEAERRRLSTRHRVRGQLDTTPPRKDQKILHTAIAGLPNAGKSTILNLMVGDKVSAVSTKRHTTRENMMGVMTEGNCQILFYDTPGFVSFKEGKDYQAELSMYSRTAIDDVDLTLLLVDASRPVRGLGFHSIKALIDRTLRSPCEVAVVMNKVDLVEPKTKLLDTTTEVMDLAQDVLDTIDRELDEEAERERGVPPPTAEEIEKTKHLRRRRGRRGNLEPGERHRDRGIVDDQVIVFMVSAKSGDGCGDMLGLFERRAKPGAWMFDRNATTDLDHRSRMTEIIRESVYKYLYKELPYRLQQQTRSLTQRRDKSVRIEQELRVEAHSQKPIVLGKLRLIKNDAEQGLSRLFGGSVDLRLHVVGGQK